MLKIGKLLRNALFLMLLAGMAGCSYPMLEEVQQASDYTYRIGPGDNVNIFVWGNPELSTTVAVRPDGKITVPLVEELLANGKTPFDLARDIEKVLTTYVKNPQVVVMVSGFKGIRDQQVRVIGRIGNGGGGSSSGAGRSSGGSSGGLSGGSSGGSGSGGGMGRYQGRALPYERGMTLLDVVIEIGLDQYADGNRARVIREVNGELKPFGVRIDDLIDDADLSANVLMMPGDILIIPDAYF